MAVHVQKRSSAGSSDPLLHFDVLQTVLSYVGVGHHLFVAFVSKWWQELYATLPDQQLTVYNESDTKHAITCAPNMTLFSSVLATPSRVKLAHKSGVSCISRAYWRAAGLHADTATLRAAHQLGMNYTKTTMAGAAECNKLAEVQFLYGQGCYWPSGLLENASNSGYFELVRWCYEHGCPCQDANQHLRYAAETGSVALMASLLQ
jgi:hypothetical protein